MKLFFSKIIPTFIFLVTVLFTAKGQASLQSVNQNSLPTVFMIGEFNAQYEEKMPGYSTLLEASGGDMESAFGKLTSMMNEMEAYADLTGFDLKGINAWMHFFWRKDGSIEHIGFHLKPNSRNVDTDDLKNFLAEFARNYRFPLTASVNFAHYSSFSFPMSHRSNINGTAKMGNDK